MPSSVGAQMGHKLGAMAHELRRASRPAVEAAALRMTTLIRQEIAQDSGGDSRLSGVGRKGAKVGAGFDVKGTDNPTALIRARGPLHLIANKTKPHRIEPKRRKRALVLKDGQVRAAVDHPGTRGKDTWNRGVRKGMDPASRILRLSTTEAIKRGLRK